MSQGEARRRPSRWTRLVRSLRGLPSLGALIAPGVVDAALSSLAGFSAAVFASRQLSAAELGLFGVVFAATIFARSAVTQLLLVPYAQHLLGIERRRRASGLARIARPALPLTVFAAILTLSAGLPLRDAVGTDAFIAISLSGALTVVVAPLFDFARRVLHLSGNGWDAAAVSGSQLFATLAGLGILVATGTPDPYIPFGSLLISFVVAIGLGLTFGGIRTRTLPRLPSAPLGELLRAGAPLFVGRSIGGFASVLAPILIATLASAEEAGRAEAARVAAQPIFVLAIGLSQTLGPPLMEAGHDRDRSKALRFGRAYAGVIIAFGLAYTLLVGIEHPLNPMTSIVPAAFAVTGLAAARILANTVSGVESAPAQVLLGARKNSVLLRFSVVHAIALTGTIALLAARLGAFALPIAEATSSGSRALLAFPAANKTLHEPGTQPAVRANPINDPPPVIGGR